MVSRSSRDESLMRIKRSTYTFQFEIDYSKSKNLPIRKHIFSPRFSAGGYDWSLIYYPRGFNPEHGGSHISLYLHLESEVDEKIVVEYSFGILNNDNKFTALSYDTLTTFTSNKPSWGYEKIFAKDRIEHFYCRNDMVVVSCNFRVLTKPEVIEKSSGGLCNHIEKVLEKGERFDVTFEVEGERISAHRFMLAARSPVFETELYGPMAEAKMEHIKINEMKPEVFKSLLHFIYTDQLPKDGSGDVQSVEVLQGLLAAADRYLLDKLTHMCEKKLEKKLSVDTVMTTLSSADRHSRLRLKQKCLEFASNPKNFSQVALTDGYLNVLSGAPSLLAELKKEVNGSNHSAKIQIKD